MAERWGSLSEWTGTNAGFEHPGWAQLCLCFPHSSPSYNSNHRNNNNNICFNKQDSRLSLQQSSSWRQWANSQLAPIVLAGQRLTTKRNGRGSTWTKRPPSWSWSCFLHFRTRTSIVNFNWRRKAVFSVLLNDACKWTRWARTWAPKQTDCRCV